MKDAMKLRFSILIAFYAKYTELVRHKRPKSEVAPVCLTKHFAMKTYDDVEL